jgi:hypothetical protein
MLRTHGYSGSIEQKGWKRLKQRCLNPNSKDFEVYSKIGMCEEFKEFMNFFVDIGPVPEDFVGRPSVDRKDNTLGYIKGNVKWSNDTEQARNKGKYDNNTSGVSGVYLHIQKTGKSGWVASWYVGPKKQKTKYFSVDKYGDELAFFAACEVRDIMIQRLNLAGAGYTENHGK